jgi:ubiquinone/menaquinone biosynthesis C-methylase UbiE
VLEVGSNCGPNVYLLAKKFPNAKIVGVDINPLAVERGNDLLRREGFSNAKLICTKADELAQFENKSFDVVFTDAVLIYIGPDKIMNTIKEFTRLAKKGLVFVEWQSPKPDSGLGEYFNGNWIRDYTTLLSNFASKEKIQVRKLLREDWPDERWSTIGAIINCEL